MIDQPHCPSCHAPVSARATSCVICDAPLVPNHTSGAVESMAAWTTDESLALDEELRDLYHELSRALAPSIRLSRLLGEGGMGLVFLGRDASLKRDVAVKVLSPRVADDAVARARFTREAEAAASVQHPNVVSVYQVGELVQSRIPYFVMQYVEGPTLADATGRVLPESRARRLIVDIASALAAAHRRRVVHRDVKPGNVIIDGETGHALVLDFGISAALSSRRRSTAFRLTTEGMYLGTPTYMSPEQASGEQATEKSDVYALGILAYELLTGAPPFDGNLAQVLAAHVRERPPSLLERRPDLSGELPTIVERCLEKDPARRPRAQDVLDFLEPEKKARLEWPPPGLLRLRRAGGRAAASVGAISTAVIAFFAILLLQPVELTDTPWSAMAGSLRGADLGAAWSLALGACMAFVVASIVVLAARVVRAARLLVAARQSGYPWLVALDVMADHDRRSEELLNGTGGLAFVGEGDRARLLRLRRARSFALAAAGVVALVAVVAWMTGLIGGWAPGEGALLPVSEGGPVLVAVIAPLALYFALGIPELRRRRLERGTAHEVRRDSGASVQPELVRGWLTAARTPAPRGPLRHPVPRAVVAIVTVLVCGAAAIAVVVVVAIAVHTALRLTPARATASVWVASAQERRPGTSAALPVVGREALPALFADPGDARGLGLVGDRRLAPDARLALAAAIAPGFCLDAREMLFGVDPGRVALLEEASRRLADVPDASSRVARWRTWLELHGDDGAPLPPELVLTRRTSDNSAGAWALGLLGMRSMQARVRACGG